jgi:hypothetical protein
MQRGNMIIFYAFVFKGLVIVFLGASKILSFVINLCNIFIKEDKLTIEMKSRFCYKL